MKILILCLPGIGDSLMATPMIRSLRRKFPHATIEILCMFKSVEYIFKNNPFINNVYFVPIFTDSRLKAIYHILPFIFKRYDISILAFPAFRKEYHVVQWIIHAKRRLVHKFKIGYFNELHFLSTDFVDVNENEHNVINNLKLLNVLGISMNSKMNEYSYDLKIDKTDLDFGKEYINNLGWDRQAIVGIHPGSIDSPAGLYKRWPIKRYISLANKLIDKGFKIIVFFGPFEEELGKKIYEGIDEKKNFRMAGKVPFGQSLGILNNVKFFISNDNGFAHIANALKIKSVTLFGPTNPLWCSPYDKKYATVLRKASFVPWFRNDMKVTNPPKGVKGGMENIKVEDVLEVIDNV